MRPAKAERPAAPPPRERHVPVGPRLSTAQPSVPREEVVIPIDERSRRPGEER